MISSILDRLTGRGLAVVVALLLLATTFLVFNDGPGTRRVTADFARTVSIYQGSEVRVMGVNIGRVTAVIPEGDHVRVEMEYSEDYKLPADAKAAIITPTLVADRFVQIEPAYDGGPVMADGAKIEAPDTAVPVELDRIYASLSNLTTALGPNGVNRDGTLNELLDAGNEALAGNGQLGNDALKNLSAAVKTFADASPQLFDTVESLSGVTSTLAANDKVVSQFMGDLSAVSGVLAGERDELRGALASLARAIGIVRTFVKDHKGALTREVKQLSRIIGVLASEKDALATVIQLAPLGLGNLAIGGDAKYNSMGARVQITPLAYNLDGMLCDVVVNGKVPNAETVCALLKQILAPVKAQLPDLGAGFTPPELKLGGSKPADSLTDLVGRLQESNR